MTRITAPSKTAVSTTPVLRRGLDRLPSDCSSCGGKLIEVDPPSGANMFGSVDCVMRGTILAYLLADFTILETLPS